MIFKILPVNDMKTKCTTKGCLCVCMCMRVHTLCFTPSCADKCSEGFCSAVEPALVRVKKTADMTNSQAAFTRVSSSPPSLKTQVSTEVTFRK